MSDNKTIEKKKFEIGLWSFVLAILCPPLWIAIYLYFLLNSVSSEEE